VGQLRHASTILDLGTRRKGHEKIITIMREINYNYISVATRQWEVFVKMRVIQWGGMDWIHLALGKDQWRALVNLVTEFLVA
jgi:hypothetical protein